VTSHCGLAVRTGGLVTASHVTGELRFVAACSANSAASAGQDRVTAELVRVIVSVGRSTVFPHSRVISIHSPSGREHLRLPLSSRYEHHWFDYA